MTGKIRVSSGVEARRYHDVLYVRDTSVLSNSDQKELSFWNTDPVWGPQGDLFDNIIHKSNFIRVFNKLLPELRLTGEETVLEMGGGHCWASVLLKRKYPGCYVVANDLSPDALRFAGKYEDVLGTSVDEKWAFNCRRIPFDGEQFDLIFTFSAFHHFGEKNDFSTTMKEIVRVLRPGGRAVLLYEPSSPQWIYKPAFQRVNKKRAYMEDIDEDVLVLPKIKQACEQLNCRFRVEYFTSFEEREGIVETVYYYAMTRLKPLRPLLPCTVNVVIEKS